MNGTSVFDIDNRDDLIDRPFNIAPFDGSMKAGEWWVLTGMRVALPSTVEHRPPGTRKLLVFANTVSRYPGPEMAGLGDLDEVLVMGHTIDVPEGSVWRAVPGEGETFRMALIGNELRLGVNFHFTLRGERRGDIDRRSYGHRWTNRTPQQNVIEFYSTGLLASDPQIELFAHREVGPPGDSPAFDAAGRTFLARLLLAAQSLIDAGRPEDADQILDRLDALLALNPDAASWQTIAAQCALVREMRQPRLPGSDRVPLLSREVYGNIVRDYVPALTAFADRFDHFVDRSSDIEHRKRAARLMIAEQDNALRFQALVVAQLEENLDDAIANLDRAAEAIERQDQRVAEAEQAFQRGLERWRQREERRARLAIAMAVASAVIGVAKIVAGKPSDMSGVAAQIARAGQDLARLAQILQTLAKIIKSVIHLTQAALKIRPMVLRMIGKRAFADGMADLRRASTEMELDGAPSESAYWDQFRVEIETALAPALDEGIPGAGEFLKEMTILTIYGHALTAARAAIPPLVQELAQAKLLEELAGEQREAIEHEISALQNDAASPGLAVALWLRHRAVRRAMFAALQDFDAAHRYWALTAERPQRNPNRSITDMTEDLVDIADMQASVERALAGFDPSPQNFTRVSFDVPADAVADFLRDGSFTLHFRPDSGPVAGWGQVGRVRVHEVAAWVIWNDEWRPRSMEFTVRSDGNYFDQRVQSGEVLRFDFFGPRVNRTFRYDPARETHDREAAINVRARVADDFRALYSEPTLFTTWQFSLPREGGAIPPEAIAALAGKVKGIELEFSGSFIKDADRFL